eukprot:XP_011679738.1 PREDICTED: uncharacterized protein LOC105445647 [Strongylocentrotus purpuratus]
MARAPTSSSSGSSMSSSSSPSDDLTDGELWAISHQITMSSFVDLGHEVLGYSFDEVEEALTACESNTEKASMRLLRRWRNEQPSNKDATKDLLDRLIKAEQIEKNVRESFSGHVDLEKTVDAVNEASCEGTDLVPSDYPAQLVSKACKRRTIYLEVLPGPGLSEPSSTDSNGQREEDPGRNAAVETSSFSSRPCNKVHTLQTYSATAAVDAVNETSCEGTDLLSRDYSAESVRSACKKICNENRRTIYLDVFPCSGTSEPSGMDSNGQREEDPGRSAAVETNSSPFKPCKEVLTLKTDSATAAKNSDYGNEQEVNTVATGEEVRESSSESGIDFVQGSYKPLSDEEVFNIAEDIESDAQIENLGVALTFSRADITRYLGTNEILGSKTSRGSRMMIFDWRQTIRQRDQRASFKGALVRAGLVMIADQYFPDVQEMTESLSSDSVDEHASTLRSVARDIESDNQMCAIGRELGFSESVLDRFAASNRIEGMVTCKGNTDMLFEWRQEVVPSELPFRLKKALRQAGLVFLAEKHFSDILQPEEPCLDKLSAKATAIAYLRKHLIDYYKTETCQIQRKPWDPEDFADLKNLFTNIIVYFVNKNTGAGMRQILPGSVSDVFRVRVNGLLPNRILLVAEAGRGKTCTVAKMAYDWSYQEESSPLCDIPLFFALKLRVVDEDMSLGEAILSETLGNIHGVTPESLEGFIGRHEDDCGLALDGYDEYKGKLSTKNPKSSIILAIGNKLYRRCRLIVTSRPYLEKEFKVPGLARIYTKMEIEGFTQSQVTSFMEKYFTLKSKPEEVGKLTEFLHGNAFIDTIISIPLFCMMICHLWEEGLLNQVSSMTGCLTPSSSFYSLIQDPRTTRLNVTITPSFKTSEKWHSLDS